MKILFIGGNGNISWYCVQKALEYGHQVWVLNRGETRKTRRAVQPEVRQIICDIRNKKQVEAILSKKQFDVVCDFICYNSIHAQTAMELFQNKIAQYIFVSSEAIYKRKSENLPFMEQSEKYDLNVNSNYIVGKLQAEKKFKAAYNVDQFPVTIIRPGYTYDTIMPCSLGHNCFTLMKNVIKGSPMLVYGEGNNLWVPLHSSDFAEAFIKIIGNKLTIGEEYQITAEKMITMNEMADTILSTLNIKNKKVIHIPYDDVLNMNSIKEKELTKQQMWHYIYDNSKLKAIAPDWKQTVDFKSGVEKTLSWLMQDCNRCRIDENFDKQLHELYEIYLKN